MEAATNDNAGWAPGYEVLANTAVVEAIVSGAIGDVDAIGDAIAEARVSIGARGWDMKAADIVEAGIDRGIPWPQVVQAVVESLEATFPTERLIDRMAFQLARASVLLGDRFVEVDSFHNEITDDGNGQVGTELIYFVRSCRDPHKGRYARDIARAILRQASVSSEGIVTLKAWVEELGARLSCVHDLKRAS